ncbi:hypothetical protein SAMN05877809_10527 [Rhodobacter sp. JA431]|uniref:hypothetical protein n=1 Tax=Rhodobacter sp. JA431 TaxID=570013 RepID=UPI000BCCE6E9|nr:hypothetical protein [Rhodobacter sp. JA431]SOC09901.1 hypothetical protein SAMN05877809_10527 [Rhodobacter sp. JA431]
MLRPLIPALAALGLFATSVPAQELRPVQPKPADDRTAATELHAPCEMTEDSESCSRVLACVGESGLWFAGRAIGRGTGVLRGALSNGVTCGGTWTESNWFGAGQADVTCSNGETGRVYFTYQDRWTGTATGNGSMSGGNRIEIWSGNRVPEFLQNTTGQPALPCGEAAIPIS